MVTVHAKKKALEKEKTGRVYLVILKGKDWVVLSEEYTSGSVVTGEKKGEKIF